MKYKQVIICALGLLVGMTQLVWGEFQNPQTSRPGNKRDRGNHMTESRPDQRKKEPPVNIPIKHKPFESPPISRPGNRGDAGHQVIEPHGDGRTRGPNNLAELCLQMEKPLLALIPQSNFGYTLASHPTFWLYLPGYNNSINFTLKDEDTGKEIYQTKFNVESERGIISLKLPSAAPRLQVGKEYRWQFVFNCRNESKNLSVEAVVARKATTESLTSQLSSATTVMEMIDIYGKNGLWHETITTLGNLRRSYPNNVAIATRWNSLLEQDGIRFPDYDLTKTEIQNCCNVSDQ